ncbi:MAG: hypothetical protein WA294_17185 [Acidobacteriaceae bacterium]
MRSSMFAMLLLGSLPALAAPPASAQASARIVYTFEHPQLQPSRYTISIDESGAGHFVSQPGQATWDSADSIMPAPIDRAIHLDDGLRAQLFAYARSHEFFNDHCDRGRAGMAFTGNKTLTYTGPDGHGTCAFIWGSDPELQRIADQLNAVAFTLEIGRRLDMEDQHDRLGLDSELASLQDAIREQRASDLPNIAPELQTIAQDEMVMDRARKRAQVLLSRCEDPPKRN